jgi:hypothetical protein
MSLILIVDVNLIHPVFAVGVVFSALVLCFIITSLKFDMSSSGIAHIESTVHQLPVVCNLEQLHLSVVWVACYSH